MSKEKISFVAIATLFIGAMVAVFIWATPSIGHMAANNWFVALIGFICLLGAPGALYLALKNFEDPNFDVWRKIMIGAAIAATAIFGTYHAQLKADKADKIAYEVQN